MKEKEKKAFVLKKQNIKALRMFAVRSGFNSPSHALDHLIELQLPIE